ncbi:Hypothetical predicted protein [Cloeon dipterum]|uniref:Vacuolar ATPase assembly integral membrane protein VMA21 homolog n=1 Tax=Cloeon dipterum TaxID=197152 RepID=A0A8S1CA63_9INSE|nr:Hypothetical predicted protein [Cloeon dipterum]
MQQEDPCERSRDLISRGKDSSCRLTCGHCSRELIGQVEDLIVDAHGLLCLNRTDGEGDESGNNNCTDTAVWFLKEGPWPDWITQQVDESGWTKVWVSREATEATGAVDQSQSGLEAALNMSDTQDEGPIWDEQARRNVRTFGLLFFYSCLMFTLPFGAFYGTRWTMTYYCHIDGFRNTCWSVGAAVVVIHIIAFTYAYHAYCEDKKDVAANAASKERLNEKMD